MLPFVVNDISSIRPPSLNVLSKQNPRLYRITNASLYYGFGGVSTDKLQLFNNFSLNEVNENLTARYISLYW